MSFGKSPWAAAAVQFLAMLTRDCRTLEDFERERRILIDAGVRPDFRPDARRLGRAARRRVDAAPP